jgi:hypothetical protein
MSISALVLAAMLAAAPAADDIAEKIISVPVPSAYRVDGLKSGPDIHSDPKVQGGKALRVRVPAKSAHAWDVAVTVPINKPVKSGDALVLAFWARLAEGDAGATTAELPYNAVQLAASPYTAVFSGPVTAGPEWKLHSVKGVVDHDYKAGELNVALHLATAKQVVEIGPVFVLDLGKP